MACYVCGYPSVLKCRECGKSVCNHHYDYSDGKCTACHEKQFSKPAPAVEVKPAIIETKPAAAPVVKPALPKAKKGRK